MAQNIQVKTSNPPGLVTPKNPYSQLTSVVGAECLVTISGQLGVDSDGRLADDFAGEVRQAFANMSIALASQGLSVANVMHLRHYVVAGQDSAQDLATINEARVAFLGEGRPASSLIFVIGLARPGARYEVDAIAAR